MSDYDAIDLKLIQLLQEDGRRSLVELGEAVGAPATTVNDRIKRLQKRGVITGFHAHLDSAALGLDLLALIFVGWSDPKTEPVFIERIRACAHVLECHHVTGVWNYALKVRVKNTRALETFLADTIKSVDGVQRTETLIALSTVKETWALTPVGLAPSN